MRYTPRQYAAALHQAISGSSPADQDKVLDNFVKILKENGDLKSFEDIEKEFHAYEQESRGITTAQVTTASPLSAEQEKKLVAELNDYVSGKVELRKKVDEGLIGGVVIKIGDELLDASLSTNLDNLKKKLVG
ncbi:MAG: ATP synthase subunit delta [Parcubacteria group bacterium GW2011_GWA2_51_12]|nr:MAG: ATP synthase subunit delta [Parcubacteria group bacterium GW2011_GWA2_51_12]